MFYYIYINFSYTNFQNSIIKYFHYFTFKEDFIVGLCLYYK